MQNSHKAAQSYFFSQQLLSESSRKRKIGGTHYTIFGYRHRCAKIMSEPKGATPSGHPHRYWEKE